MWMLLFWTKCSYSRVITVLLSSNADQPAAVCDVLHLPPSPPNGDTSLEKFSYGESKIVAVFEAKVNCIVDLAVKQGKRRIV